MIITTDVAALAELLRVMVGFAAPRPADNAIEGEESAEVCTVTPLDDVPGMEPTVTPVIVTVTVVLTAIDAVVVITKELLPLGCWATDAAPTLLTIAVGGVASAETKNPAGYISVMELPGARAPPAVVANANVTIAAAFPTVRSDADIVKEFRVTWLPMEPAEKPAEATVSALVATWTTEGEETFGPIVRPLIVIVTAEFAGIASVPVVVMTMVLAIVALGPVAVAMAPPLIPTVGFPVVVTKKPGG